MKALEIEEGKLKNEFTTLQSMKFPEATQIQLIQDALQASQEQLRRLDLQRNEYQVNNEIYIHILHHLLTERQQSLQVYEESTLLISVDITVHAVDSFHGNSFLFLHSLLP